MVDRPRFAIEVHANPPKNLCHLTCVTICGYIARRILAAARVALGPLRCFFRQFSPEWWVDRWVYGWIFVLVLGWFWLGLGYIALLRCN